MTEIENYIIDFGNSTNLKKWTENGWFRSVSAGGNEGNNTLKYWKDIMEGNPAILAFSYLSGASGGCQFSHTVVKVKLL